MLQLNNQFETGSQQNILEEDFFFENALDLFCVLDVSGRFIRLNKQWNKLLGWVVEDMLECSIVEFVHPDDVDYVNLMIENASLSTVSNAENRIISKSGEIFWISWRLVVHPDSGNIFGVGREITKEKHNIQKLEEEGRRYNLAMRAADTGIWDWLIPQNKIHYSGAWKMQLGYEKDELIESFETWQILLHPDDYERVIKAFGDYLSHPSSIFEIEYRLRHKDGTYRWIHNRAASLIGKDGKPYRMLGAHQDITEQKIFENE
ncbi:MAG: PAS domain-containing protein, partial [Bacteroidetes bacterium]|nr:PAS domain-containing protein [Bacteroidota bacterium]